MLHPLASPKTPPSSRIPESVFRLLRVRRFFTTSARRGVESCCHQRHKFTIPFALEDARDLLLWRLAVIPDELPRPAVPFLQCLPLTARDLFDRPIVVVKLAKLFEASEDVRPTLINYLEVLRLTLERVNGDGSPESEACPILQYIALMDIGGISMQNVVRLRRRQPRTGTWRT